ncbi:unnamed protein product, partial [Prorocentrum cordatum]
MREGSGRAVRRRLARRSFRPAPPVRVEAQFAARAQVAVRRGGGGGESEEDGTRGKSELPYDEEVPPASAHANAPGPRLLGASCGDSGKDARRRSVEALIRPRGRRRCLLLLALLLAGLQLHLLLRLLLLDEQQLHGLQLRHGRLHQLAVDLVLVRRLDHALVGQVEVLELSRLLRPGGQVLL